MRAMPPCCSLPAMAFWLPGMAKASSDDIIHLRSEKLGKFLQKARPSRQIFRDVVQLCFWENQLITRFMAL
jgi:hypothetical protein